MNTFHKVINSLAILSLVLTSVFGAVQPVQAQAYRGLVIDQFEFRYGTQPRGKVINGEFTILHDFQQADKVVKLYLRANDFTADGVTGTPKFIMPGTLSPQASLASWITFPITSITLDHYGQKEIVPFTITIPEDSEPGDKYAAILLSDKEGQDAVSNDNATTELGMSKEIGPLVFLTSDGEIHRGMVADAFYTSNIWGKTTKFFFNLPVFINAKLQNTGNVFAQPLGAIYVYKGTNFQDYLMKFELNDKNSSVLAYSTRIFSFEWNDGFLYDVIKKDPQTGKTSKITKVNWDRLSKLRIGKFNAKLIFTAVSDSNENVTIEKSTYFWIIPWPLIILIIAIIVLTGLYITSKKLKSIDRKKKERANISR